MEEIKKTATENLIKLAMGMEVTDEIIEVKSVKNEQGEMMEVERKVRTTKRSLPPDLNAILQLLGKNGLPEEKPASQAKEFPLEILTQAQLKKLAKMGF